MCWTFHNFPLGKFTWEPNLCDLMTLFSKLACKHLNVGHYSNMSLIYCSYMYTYMLLFMYTLYLLLTFHSDVLKTVHHFKANCPSCCLHVHVCDLYNSNWHFIKIWNVVIITHFHMFQCLSSACELGLFLGVFFTPMLFSGDPAFLPSTN